MNVFYTLLTPVGLAKVANAQLTQSKVAISHIAVGDSNGTNYPPTGNETALKKEKWRGSISGIAIDTANPNWIVVEAILPATVGGFTLREVALYDEVGDMIAIGNYPDTYKPVASDGSTMDLVMRTIIEVSNADSVTLKIDPNVIVASRKYVDDKVAEIQTTVNEHLSEAVTKTKASKSYYVNASAGSDSNDGLTVNTAFKTTAKAISLIPQVVNHNIIINIAEGSYNETITLDGYIGSGTITVSGNTTSTNTHIVNNIVVNRVQVPVVLRGLKCVSVNAHTVLATYSNNVHVQYIKDDTPSTFNGIHYLSTKGRIYSSEFSNKNAAIYSELCSTIYSEINSGVSNSFGLSAYKAGVIGKTGTQPTGVVAEASADGGVIRQ
ncbi:phage tail protein [Lysinibacillus sp. TE18511]